MYSIKLIGTDKFLGSNSREVKRKIAKGKLKDGTYEFYTSIHLGRKYVFSVEYKTVVLNNVTLVKGYQFKRVITTKKN